MHLVRNHMRAAGSGDGGFGQCKSCRHMQPNGVCSSKLEPPKGPRGACNCRVGSQSSSGSIGRKGDSAASAVKTKEVR